MKVTLNNGKTLGIKWQHQTSKKKKFTKVIISEVLGEGENEHEEFITEQVARPIKGDIFNKNIGRVRSLTKALATMFPHNVAENKPVRLLVWDAYKKLRKGSIVREPKISRLKRQIEALKKLIPKELIEKELKIEKLDVE